MPQAESRSEPEELSPGPLPVCPASILQSISDDLEVDLRSSLFARRHPAGCCTATQPVAGHPRIVDKTRQHRDRNCTLAGIKCVLK